MSDVAPESLVLPRVRPAKPLKISFAFWGLHTPGKSSAYKLIFLNYLKIRLFSKCSIWNDEKIFQFRGGNINFFKFYRSCSTRTRDLRVSRPKLHLLRHRERQQILAIQTVLQCVKSPRCDALSHGVSRILNDINTFL